MGEKTAFRIKTSLGLSEILEYITAFLLIISCNSIYYRLSGTDLHIDEITAVFAIGLVLVRIIRRPAVNKRTLMVIGVLLAVSLLYFVATRNFSSTNLFIILFFIILPCMIFYLSCVDVEKITDIYRRFSNIIFIISAVSTFVWFFSEIIPLLSMNMSATISWGDVHQVRGFYGLYFECQKESTFGFSNFYRNTGIFCEAPMHSLLLSLSLGYEMFFRKKLSSLRVLFLILFIVTTLSSTGFLCIAACILLKYFQNSKRSGGLSVFRFVVLIILCVVAYFFVNFLLETKSSTSSYSIRMIDYVVGAKAWIDNPVFGTGFNNLTRLYEYKASMLADAGINRNTIGFSNSTMAIIGQGGTVLAVLYFLPFIKILAKRGEAFRKYKLWIILIMLLMVTTIFNARIIMVYFLALGYVLAFELGKAKNLRLSKRTED